MSFAHNAKLIDGRPSKEHPLYRTWRGMRERCGNPNHKDYAIYGGRGIRVADEWDSFETFASDMGPRPLGYSLDRINPNGPYSKENCRWADAKTQANNARPRRTGFLKGAYKNNITGESGVYLLTSGRYRVQIWSANRSISLGCFGSLEEALTAKQDFLKTKGLTANSPSY